MAARIAELTGTFIVPGVSKNRRLYTAEHARRAVDRMKARLADPTGRPITMLTHHGAGDDSTRIAARVTDAWVDENDVAWWRADVADNDAGRSIAALTTPDRPYLRNVSLRGWWLGDPRTVIIGGQPCETADDLEVDGIDFTKNPGVDGARITAAVTETGRTPITESVEVRLMPETADTVYADPGYLEGHKRLPLGTRSEIRAAWAVAQTSEAYTPNQLKRIRERVRKAAAAADFDVVAETNDYVATITEALEEAYASMSLDTGAGEVRVAGYTPDPADLAAVARKVALAALAAQTALDPDADGDIDLGDGTDETTPAAPAVEETTDKEAPVGTETTTATAPAVPAPPKPLAEMDENELRAYAVECQNASAPVAETAPAAETQPEAETTETTEAVDKPLTKADIAGIVAETVKALKDPAAETTEVKPETATTETVDERAELKAEIRKEILDEMAPLVARSGHRKGLVRETEAATKPLHEMTDEEFRAYRNDTLGALLPS